MSAQNDTKTVMPTKKKAGRPNLHPELDDRLMVRCSKSDKEVWTERAVKLGFSGASQWIRKLVSDAMAKPVR